jgi:hypothetical protein
MKFDSPRPLLLRDLAEGLRLHEAHSFRLRESISEREKPKVTHANA